MNNDHFLTCETCGKQIDKRDLGQVLAHGWMNKDTGEYECYDTVGNVTYSSSMRVGDSVQWTKEKRPLNLN